MHEALIGTSPPLGNTTHSPTTPHLPPTPPPWQPSQTPPSEQRHAPVMNTSNLRSNTTFGDEFQLPKSPQICRFLSMNINGIHQANACQDACETTQALKLAHVDIWHFQETNINWRSPLLGQCYAQLHKVFHHTRMAISSSQIIYRTNYQPGGTMSAVTNDFVGRVVETGSDAAMGRWSFTRLLGKHGRHIVMVSVYQVCNQQATTAGNRTAYAQQLSLLRRNGRDCSP